MREQRMMCKGEQGKEGMNEEVELEGKVRIKGERKIGSKDDD